MAISPSALSIAQTSPRDRTLANSLNRPRNLWFPRRVRDRKNGKATRRDLDSLFRHLFVGDIDRSFRLSFCCT